MGSEPESSAGRPATGPHATERLDALAPTRAPTTQVSGPSSEAPACQAGDMVDHFQVIRLIGRGGMGEVYLAYDTELGRRVALKMVIGEWLTSEEAIERFLFEVRTTAKFNHPNIVTVYAAGKHEGRPYVALEYLKGQNLRQRMEERPPGPQESLRIMLAVAEALEEAHRHGVLHRDLKPENVIIPLDGRLRVVDFGLAKQVQGVDADLLETFYGEEGAASVRGTALEGALAKRAHETGSPESEHGLKGTPAYMAPEQWLDLESTAATDIWAFGVILFELCARRLPYDHENLSQQLSAVCSQDLAPRIDEFVQVPEELSSLIARCLDKDPSFRPMTSEVAASLRDMLFDTAAAVSGRESPFRGLLPFAERHAGLFFGREAEIAAFVERVRHQPALPVVGPSGAGKSSFIQAGVIPRMREQEPWTVLQLRPGNQPFLALATRLVRRDTWDGRSRQEDSLVGSPEADRDSRDDATADSITDDPTRSADEDDDAQVSALAATVVSDESPTQLHDQATRGAMSATSSPSGASGREPVRVVTASASAPQSVSGGERARLAEDLLESPSKLSLHLRALAEQKQAKVLLFVDQLEELFTLVDDHTARERFIQALCTAAEDPHDPVRVVFTVRDDFLGRLAVSAEAREALAHVTVIQRLDRAALEQTLLRPAEVAGHGYDDPTLVPQMVASVEGEPAGLPLLQFAAQMLWERRDTERQLLLRSAYEEIGGVEGALAKHADGVLDGLSPDELKLARELLLRLVTPERTRKVISKSAALEGLDVSTGRDADSHNGDDAEHVLGRLTQARLVNVSKVRGDEEGEAVLELAHESLIHTWTTLSRWIDEGREELAFLAEVGQAAELWDRRGRRPDELWRGGALEEALRTAARCTTQLPELVSDFLTAAQNRQQRRQRRVRLAVASAIGLSAAVAVIATLVALFVADKEREAREQRDLAEQREARALEEGARAALGEGHLLEARSKLRAALEKEERPSTAARGLWWQLERNPLVWTKEFGATIYEVAFAPDGKTVAAACQDQAVYLLDTQTREARIFRGHDDQVLAVDFSPDGSRLATASWSGEIRLWNAKTGAEIRSFKGHAKGVRTVAYSPNGKLLASGNYNREIRLWDAASGELRKTLKGHERVVIDARFSHDGKLLASASSDRTVRVWDVEAGVERNKCTGHAESVLAVDFSPDQKLLASGARDSRIRIWNPATCELLRELQGHTGAVSAVRFGPQGRLLVSGGRDGTVRLWNAREGRQLSVHHGHTAGVWDVAFSSDGTRIASGGGDNVLRLWSTTTEEHGHTPTAHTSAVWTTALSDDGSLLASASLDGTVRLWDVPTGRLKRILTGHTAPVRAVDISPDAKWVASGGEDNTVCLWDPATGKKEHVLIGHAAAVRSVAFSPNGKQLISASLDDTVRLWNVGTGKLQRVIADQVYGVYSVQFGPNGDRIASGGLDRTIRLLETRGRATARILGHGPSEVWGVSFSPDGQSIASVAADGAVQLWDLDAAQATTLGHHPVRGSGAAYHPDGNRIYSSGAGDSALVWSLEGGEPVVLRGHRGDVNCVSISADGRFAATGGDDTTVRVWRTEGAKPYWHAPVLLGSPPRLVSHRGWERIDQPAGVAESSDDEDRDAEQSLGPQLRAALEQRTRSGDSVGDQLVCLRTFGGTVEVWDLRQDRRIAEQKVDKLAQVLALPTACLARGTDGVQLFDATGGSTKLPIAGPVSALSWNAGVILAAASRTVHVLTEPGKIIAKFEANAGVITALGGQGLGAPAGEAESTDRWLAVGYRDGNVELVSFGDADDRPSHAFEGVSASPPVRMMPGPMGTLVVGYADGLLGMWNVSDGKQLGQARLHGPVVHLLVEGQHLYAASELGEHLSWDLGAFDLTHCELLGQVWRGVPTVWRGGKPTLLPAPAHHECAPKP